MAPEAFAGPIHPFADARTAKPAVDPGWSAVTDRVMGGVSDAGLTYETVDGRWAWRLRGQVKLENNGGFVQMRAVVREDLRKRAGVVLNLRGNDETYVVSLRTADVRYPWQSYRAELRVPARWQTMKLSWSDFAPYRIEAPLDVSTIRSLHLLGVGRAFEADLSVASVAWR